MRIVLDNIIYALQRYGGISVVWTELLERARKDKDLQLTELDYRSGMPLRWLERYREPAWTPTAPTLFHSSYFRVSTHPLVKNITTVHDLTYHFYRRGLAKTVHLKQEEFALRHSAAVICVSEHTKRDLLSAYPWIKEEQVQVVYNGVGEEFFPIPSTKKQGYLLYVGSGKAAYKRLDVARMVAQQTGLPLVQVASPDITREQLNRYYNKALCLLYPSDYEGFGLPILEAQKAGCPVIAQAVASIPEVIGPNGLTVAHDTPEKVAAAMTSIVRELQSRPTQAIIENGLTNARRFSWDTMYEQTKHVYESIDHHHHL